MNLAIQPSLPSESLVASLEGLLAATARGDRQAFAELYRLTHRRFYAIALALTRQPEVAEDILQESYLAIWRTSSQYQAGRAPALVWLMAIVRHRAIEFLRQRRRRVLETSAEPLADEALQAPDPQALESIDLIAHAIRECLRRLPPEQAHMIGLAFFHGFSHEELAARLQTPLGTVKSWVRRGLLQLKVLGNMKRNEAEQIASDYVLGTLSDPELAEFEAILSQDPILRQQVAAWERRLTPLATVLPEETPRTSVWEAIETVLDAQSPPNTVTVRAQEGEWRNLAPGIEIKLLLVDREAGFQSFLLKLVPGSQIPAHDHSSLEECPLLKGDMIIGDRYYTSGDYHAALPGSRHATLSTRAGGIVLLRSELRPELHG